MAPDATTTAPITAPMREAMENLGHEKNLLMPSADQLRADEFGGR